MINILNFYHIRENLERRLFSTEKMLIFNLYVHCMQQKILMLIQPTLEEQLHLEEKRFEEALKADKEFSVLKEIRNNINQLKNELYIQNSFWRKEKG